MGVLPMSDDMAFSVLETEDRGFIIAGVTYSEGKGDVLLLKLIQREIYYGEIPYRYEKRFFE